MKKIKYILILVLIYLIIPISVLGAGGTEGSETNDVGKCKYDWCYYGLGVRVSVYDYNGETYKVIGTNDLNVDIDDSRQDDNTIYYKQPKTYYFTKSLSSQSGRLDSVVKFGSFSIANYYDTGSKTFDEGAYTQIKAGLGFNSKDDEEIKKKFKNILNINIPENKSVSDLYFTYEPTILIGRRSTKRLYYLSSTELSLLRNSNGEMEGIESIAAYGFAISAYARTVIGSDPRNFIPNVFKTASTSGMKSVGYIYTDTPLTDRNKNVKLVVDGENIKKGFGIKIVWGGEYIEKKTCKTKCGANPTLECAESYCDGLESNSKKSECIKNECSVSRPSYKTCESKVCDSNNGKCAQVLNYGKTTCKVSDNNYYYIECTENTKLNYINGLPKILGPGIGGINYSLQTATENICKLYFNKGIFEYDYAGLKRSRTTDRSNMLKIAEAFNKLSSNSSDIKYNDNIAAQLKINGELVKSATNPNVSPFISISKNETTKADPTSNKNNKIINLYGNSSSNDSYSVTERSITTSGTNLYELQHECLSFKDSMFNKVCRERNLELKDYQMYYGYYNTIKTPGKVTVDLTISKSYSDGRSCNNVDNCYYMVSDAPNDTDCFIKDNKLYITNISPYYTAGGVETRMNNIIINHSRLGSTYDINDYLNGPNGADNIRIVNPGETVSIIYSTAEGKRVSKKCQVTKGTCKSTYKSSEHDAIRKYCNNSYLSDGYTSANECYNDCSKNLSCKGTIKCSSKNDVKSWCTTNYKNAGYKSYSQCYNDCNCIENSVEYIYRPVSLGNSENGTYPYNSFPNRTAGSNWIGFEEYTVDTNHGNDAYSKAPIYVIELDKEKIKKLRESTTNKYIYKDYSYYENYASKPSGAASFLNMKSPYIASNKNIFT